MEGVLQGHCPWVGGGSSAACGVWAMVDQCGIVLGGYTRGPMHAAAEHALSAILLTGFPTHSGSSSASRTLCPQSPPMHMYVCMNAGHAASAVLPGGRHAAGTRAPPGGGGGWRGAAVWRYTAGGIAGGAAAARRRGQCSWSGNTAGERGAG